MDLSEIQSFLIYKVGRDCATMIKDFYHCELFEFNTKKSGCLNCTCLQDRKLCDYCIKIECKFTHDCKCIKNKDNMNDVSDYCCGCQYFDCVCDGGELILKDGKPIIGIFPEYYRPYEYNLMWTFKREEIYRD